MLLWQQQITSLKLKLNGGAEDLIGISAQQRGQSCLALSWSCLCFHFKH